MSLKNTMNSHKSSTKNSTNFDFELLTCLNHIMSGPKLIDSEFDDVVCFKFNKLILYVTKDLMFFDFDELCRCLKRRKVKSWNSSSSWKSCFKTHFVKTGLQSRHKDRFKLLHGDQFVHVMYLEIACKAILGGFGVEWFYGEEDWDGDCGKGYIYTIYFVGDDKFKFGKADNFDVRLTNYLSEIKDRKKREQGIKVLALFKVRNMSLAEDIIDLNWHKEGFKLADNSREYFKIPKLEGETDDDRLVRCLDSVSAAISSVEPNGEVNIVEYHDEWEKARMKYPAK